MELWTLAGVRSGQTMGETAAAMSGTFCATLGVVRASDAATFEKIQGTESKAAYFDQRSVDGNT